MEKEKIPHSQRTISTDSLKEIAKNNGGYLLNVPNSYTIVLPHVITAVCQNGHQWQLPAGNLHRWCTICEVLKVANYGKGIPRNYDYDTLLVKYNPVVCLDTTYIWGQTKFRFKCARGHICVGDKSQMFDGCRNCSLERTMKARSNNTMYLDVNCCYETDHSLMRVHCDKQKHKCGSGCAELCDVDEPCNQDFYATPHQLKHTLYIYDCSKCHRWKQEEESVMRLFRVLEAMFDDRFDEPIAMCASGIKSTAYNSKYNIAAISCYHSQVFHSIDETRRWCESTGTIFLCTPGSVSDMTLIVHFIATMLFGQCAYLRETYHNIEDVMIKTLTKIGDLKAEDKLFEHRCVFWDKK